jgi:hypothetical protein
MRTRPNQSPFQVTYDDMIDAAEDRVRKLEAARLQGYSSWKNTHETEVFKKIGTLLKKFKKDPQINLFTENQKMQ